MADGPFMLVAMNTWTIPNKGPIIAPGQLNPPFDAAHAGAAHVVRRGDRYIMLYWGRGAAGNVILRADSPVEEPNRWQAAGAPLIAAQPDTDFNHGGPSFPFLLPVTDAYWLLYFCAWGKKKADGKLANTTGVAVSEDAGRSWRYPLTAPILPLDRPWDCNGTGSVWVLLEGGKFRMYYTAIGRYFPKPAGVTSGHGDVIPEIGIACAESADGIHWDKPHPALLVRPRGFAVEPYEYIVSKPCVVKDEAGFTLWVNTFGSAYRAHRLTSIDGLKWQWAERQGPDGELGVGAPGTFDDHQRSYPTLVRHGHEWRCWFTGNRFGATGMGYATMNSE
jgi:hypothetical protein